MNSIFQNYNETCNLPYIMKSKIKLKKIKQLKNKESGGIHLKTLIILFKKYGISPNYSKN